jgi:hypothetical protein
MDQERRYVPRGFTAGPQGVTIGPSGTRVQIATIPDPGGRLTPDYIDALLARYAGTIPALVLDRVDGVDQRLDAVADLVVQLLWPERYGTDPGDLRWHASPAARLIAALFFAAAAIETPPG